jgi:hypothetical protein
LFQSGVKPSKLPSSKPALNETAAFTAGANKTPTKPKTKRNTKTPNFLSTKPYPSDYSPKTPQPKQQTTPPNKAQLQQPHS